MNIVWIQSKTRWLQTLSQQEVAIYDGSILRPETAMDLFDSI